MRRFALREPLLPCALLIYVARRHQEQHQSAQLLHLFFQLQLGKPGHLVSVEGRSQLLKVAGGAS